MSSLAPRPLPENEGLAFVGEHVPANAPLASAVAKKLLAARNPNGRPNEDVVRQFAGWNRGGIREYWLVDFPSHMGDQEAALYVAPFRLRNQASRQNRDLRNALVRRERYLALPVSATMPVWTWLNSAIVPDDTLLAVARDDDFIHGLLSARPFALWWQKHGRNPALAVASYPFPWPPAKGLSDLTSTQEEQRHAIARATRSENHDALESAVASGYGWPSDLPDGELMSRLSDLNRTRG